MQKTNALKLRQSMRAILEHFKETGEPILLEKNREPAGVIISLEDYQKRFADRDADEKRVEIVERIKRAKGKLPPGKTSLDLVRELRS